MGDPVKERLGKIRENAALGRVVTEDLNWLLARHDDLAKMLRAQQGAVDDAARNWRKIGYDAGRADGYDEACRELSPDIGYRAEIVEDN